MPGSENSRMIPRNSWQTQLWPIVSGQGNVETKRTPLFAGQKPTWKTPKVCIWSFFAFLLTVKCPRRNLDHKAGYSLSVKTHFWKHQNIQNMDRPEPSRLVTPWGSLKRWKTRSKLTEFSRLVGQDKSPGDLRWLAWGTLRSFKKSLFDLEGLQGPCFWLLQGLQNSCYRQT